MALSRIVWYDREGGRVTYWYRDHLSRKQKQEAESEDERRRWAERKRLRAGDARARPGGYLNLKDGRQNRFKAPLKDAAGEQVFAV